MALTPEQAAELAKMLKEIERLSAKFNSNINTINLQNLEENAGAIKSIFEDLVRQEQELGVETDYLIDNFKELAKKIQTSSVGIQESTKGLKNLSSIAEQLNSHQKGFNNLSAKDLENLQKKSNLERDRLKRSLNTLSDEADNLKNQLKNISQQSERYSILQNRLKKVETQHSRITDLLANENITLIELNNQLDKELNTQKSIEKQLGTTGALLKGLSKIPFLGDAIDTKKALEDATDAIEQGKGSIGGMKSALKSVGSDVISFLTDPLTITSFLVTQIIDTFISLDKGIGEFAKGMNMSYQEAANLDQQFNSIANSSGDIAVTTKGIRDTMLAMGQVMGSNAVLNAQDAKIFTKLREQAGLANDELAEMEKLTLATGGNLEDNVSSMLYAAKTTALNNGVLLNEKQIMKEVAKASAATKLSLAGNPEALAKAAAQAKSLGMSLEQVDKIASGLLEIESSISNELEAELLTGRNLNLEQARLYALNNDMEGLSKEIAKNFGSVAEFSKMNRLQQEAAAKAVGMTREELAATLTDQEALKGLSGEQAKNAKAALDAARARGMSEEQIKKQGIEGLMKQQSVQERLNNSVEKLKEIFISLLDPLMPIFDIFSDIFGVIGPIIKLLGKVLVPIIKTISAILTPILEGLKWIFTGGSSGFDQTKKSWNSLGSMFSGDDIISPSTGQSGYGKRTLFGPEGAIALNDKDTVVAGTNLFDNKGDDVISPPQKITEFKSENIINNKSSNNVISPSIDYTALANAIVSALATAPMNVNVKGEVDGKTLINFIENNATAVGTAQAKGTSKIQ